MAACLIMRSMPPGCSLPPRVNNNSALPSCPFRPSRTASRRFRQYAASSSKNTVRLVRFFGGFRIMLWFFQLMESMSKKISSPLRIPVLKSSRTMASSRMPTRASTSSASLVDRDDLVRLLLSIIYAAAAFFRTSAAGFFSRCPSKITHHQKAEMALRWQRMALLPIAFDPELLHIISDIQFVSLDEGVIPFLEELRELPAPGHIDHDRSFSQSLRPAVCGEVLQEIHFPSHRQPCIPFLFSPCSSRTPSCF
jgi:hypothetical protein